ncbi:MAG TPA: hypothetical protein VFV52_11805 [Bacilli bacterium]|nr:hypothetical protein [Bacilli bacterium]
MLARLTVEASPERKADTIRNKLRFLFPTGDGKEETISCSPHTKLNGQRIRGRTTYLQDRIYFGWGREHVQNGKILIAHIGGHL